MYRAPLLVVSSIGRRRRRPLPPSWRHRHLGPTTTTAHVIGGDSILSSSSSWVRQVLSTKSTNPIGIVFAFPDYPRCTTVDVHRRCFSFQADQIEPDIISSPREWNQQARIVLSKQLRQQPSSPLNEEEEEEEPFFSQEDMRKAIILLDEIDTLVRSQKGKPNSRTNAAVDEDQENEVPVNAYLAWTLLEKVISSSSSSSSSSYGGGGITILSTHILHSVLQLWRLQLPITTTKQSVIHDKRRRQQQRQKNIQYDDKLPSPQIILEKFDDWRTGSTTPVVGLMIDVHCCNIVLAAAGRLGQYDLCQQIYHWMWKESIIDNLLRPDHITVRTILQAAGTSNRQQQQHDRRRTTSKNESTTTTTTSIHVAEECDQLVQDYINRSHRREDHHSTIYQSLLRVWANADPQQARKYLQYMVDDHLRYRTDMNLTHKYPPPSTIDWNYVISAASIQHGMPTLAAEILDDFEMVSSRLRNILSSELILSAQQSLILQNEYTEGIKEIRMRQIPKPDIFSWNILLEGWGQIGNSEQANHIYEMILSGEKECIRPNIITFTSAIKTNPSDWLRINRIAEQALTLAQEQQEDMEGQQQQHHDEIVMDAAFFHAWLQACVDFASSSDYGEEAMMIAEMIIKETMPSSGVKPSKLSFQYLLNCFIVQDDLEGGTQWLMKHLGLMDEATILEWTLVLSQKGDIELVSFLDKFTRRTPKTLLQVLIQNGHLESSNVLEHLLRNLPVDQGLQVLQWLQPIHRTLECFAIVIRNLSKTTTSGTTTSVPVDDARRVEDLWEIAQQRTAVRMSDESSKRDQAGTVGEIYTSLIVAWSKAMDKDRVLSWWSHWIQDEIMMTNAPPTIVAQTAVLSCLAATFQPKQAETFLSDLFVMYENGQLKEPPDVVMLNLVLNAWMMSANGMKATKALQTGMDYGIVPDVISYNTIIQAYVKGRQLEEAFTFAKDHVGVVDGFPDMATIRSILLGWSRHRQDYDLASKKCRKITQWMIELHSNGILKVNPQTDKGIQTILKDLEHRVLRQRKQRKVKAQQ